MRRPLAILLSGLASALACVDAAPRGERIRLDAGALDATHVREAKADGFEDWFRFERAPRAPVIRYDLDVRGFAGVRLVDRVLELLDDGGAPRLRVAAPWLVDREGHVRDVDVDVVGCEVDRDPRAPWGRPPTPPGADRCGVEMRWSVDADAYPLWVDPYWSSANALTTPRALHEATLLEDGHVLVTGGTSNTAAELASAELFDPTTATFASTSPMSEAKRNHRAIRLDDGRVLVVQGEAGTAVPFSMTRRVERYDPKTGEWTTLDDAPSLRSSSTLARLPDGRVLLLGGYDTASGASVDVVDICAATGEPCLVGPPMTSPRATHGAFTRADGSVLVAGGGANVFDAAAPIWSTTEVLDPTATSWSNGPKLAVARIEAAYVPLADDRLVVLGGSATPVGGQPLASIEILRPGAAASEVVGALTVPRWFHTSTLLPNGRVLTAGALGANFTASTVVTTETFDPESGKTALAGALPAPGGVQRATRLLDGRVLVTGGFNAERTDAATIFGDALGAACAPADPASCPNGVCVDGACAADAGSSSSSSAASTTTAAGSTSSGGASGEPRSFYGCSVGPRDAAPPVGAIVLVALAVARRGWISLEVSSRRRRDRARRPGRC